MKDKKKFYIILAVCISVMLIIIGDVIYKKTHEEPNKNEYVFLGIYEEKIMEENYIFRDIDELTYNFGRNQLTNNDFKKNNYLLLTIMYDSCSENNITPTNYKIEGNDVYVTIEYERSCGVCAPSYMYYLLKIDKSIEKLNVKYDYKVTNHPFCDPMVSKKPLLYLYPEKETNITVKVGYPNLLTSTYPKYNNEWNITALPNGILKDKDGRTYYGLYWEGKNNFDSKFNDGFVVHNDELIKFLEEKLKILGLNERESNEFIIYWLPELEKSEYNLIRFESIEEINKQMPLDITPTPDTIIRVMMKYKPLKDKITIQEQKLETPNRVGFIVIEWGGTLIN